MKHYVGIDLGTTNSAICVYDGTETRVYKSPEQADVTPSAIFVDRRGHRFYGSKAVSLAAGNIKNAATLFKRYMGTNKVFNLGSQDTLSTPVDCSAELLRHLYSYLPEEIRNDPETVTVITVPAAFNQVKKDATLEAAGLAGIGQAALIQEPVAAVMSVLKKDRSEKLFLVYDLGGGTFDVSVAEHRGGQVSLLAQGGQEMCGGRDADLRIYESKVKPWLLQNFSLDADFDRGKEYEVFRRRAILACEQAKIELSASESTFIQMDEAACSCTDKDGNELYLDVILDRADLHTLVSEMAETTCNVTRDVIAQAGIKPEDISQIIFIGGPTMYAPLRELVCKNLNIPAGTEMNPMTAVAEGASIYAESIDWSSELHERKSSYKKQELSDTVRLNYESRTANEEGQIALLCSSQDEYTAEVASYPGQEFSKTVSFHGSIVVRVPLPEPGDYTFMLSVYDSAGAPVRLNENRITITRTLATVQAIPASHSIAVKALDSLDGKAVPIYLIHRNDPLPYEGDVVFLAGTRLVARSDDSIVFTLWEGEIADPVEDNLYIGTYRIPGSMFSSGVISIGDEIHCHYTVNESGNLYLGVEIPSIGLKTEAHNFYSRAEAQTDLFDTVTLLREANELLQRSGEFSQSIFDAGLYRLRKSLQQIRLIAQKSEDPEQIQAAYQSLQDAKRELAGIRKRHLKEVRRIDLDKAKESFENWESGATVSEKARYVTLTETAEFSISHNTSDFETVINEIHHIVGNIMWRSDYVIERYFYSLASSSAGYTDPDRFSQLKKEGYECIEKGD